VQVKRTTAVVVAVLTVGTAALAGFGTWWFTRGEEPPPPQISAYSNGHLTHIGPYMYCNARDLYECLPISTTGELAADARHPIQLGVGDAVGRAPWWLLRIYDNPKYDTDQMYQPGTLTVTIPTVDPERGRLRRMEVQLLTWGIDMDTGEEFPIPHAVWAVDLAWKSHSRSG
jgi:hypothetical protein